MPVVHQLKSTDYRDSVEWRPRPREISRATRKISLGSAGDVGKICAASVLEMLRKVLLVCGVLSSLLYGAMIGLIQFEGYSRISQTPSELTAIGAPTRSLWMLLGGVYTVLVIAFGWGVCKSAGQSRAIRIVGGLMLAYGSLGLLWPFAPMHLREALAAGGSTLSDTLHIALSSVTVLLMLLAIGFSGAAFGNRLRTYSLATLLTLLTFGALTFFDAPRVAANLPTPWIGVWERVNVGVFLLWVVVIVTIVRLAPWRRRGRYDRRVDARAILAERYARGEIDAEEYATRREVLSQ
jgi:uncharacterized membrane protein